MSGTYLDNFENYARDLAVKSIHSFTLLSFSSLALSIQFSPNFGKCYLVLLFVAWIILLISGLAGGWIILKTPIFYRINVSKIRVEEHLKTLKLPQFEQTVLLGQAFKPNGSIWTINELKEEIIAETGKLELGIKNMADIEKKLPYAHKIQTIFFILGISLNILFAIINLY